MLKHEIAVKVPSVWERIKSLRISSTCDCASLMEARLNRLIEAAKHIAPFTTGEIFDPIIFETVRSDELQQIYFGQGTTSAKTAIYGWHFYGLAADIISKSKSWSVSEQWWKTLATQAKQVGLDSGYFWIHKDLPHVQFGGLKKSPSDETREAYFGTKDWKGKPILTGAAHIEGLRRVHKLVGAL